MVSGSVKGVAVRRFESCPDYTALIAGHKLRSLTQQSVVIMWIDRTDILVIPELTAWKDKQLRLRSSVVEQAAVNR